MKNTILFLIAFLMISVSYGQTQNGHSSEYYLQKKRTNATAAWVLLGLGVGGIAGGIALDFSDNFMNSGSYNNTGLTLSYIGGGMAFSSIPLFVAAHKNKKKAAEATFAIQNQHYLTPDLASGNQPAVTLTISF
jgi:hypothetical protein